MVDLFAIQFWVCWSCDDGTHFECTDNVECECPCRDGLDSWLLYSNAP